MEVGGVVGGGVVGVVGGGGGMVASGGQVELLASKVTSARCIQLAVEGEVNTKVNTFRIELTVLDMHTLTR